MTTYTTQLEYYPKATARLQGLVCAVKACAFGVAAGTFWISGQYVGDIVANDEDHAYPYTLCLINGAIIDITCDLDARRAFYAGELGDLSSLVTITSDNYDETHNNDHRPVTA